MLFRSVLIALLFSPVVHAQLERFEEDDLPKWALIARVATDFEEFDLTSTQLDKLKEAEIQNNSRQFLRMRDRQAGQVESAKESLNTVYEVLDERQETRLHEIMFQRWMNRDALTIALKAFAPNEVEDVGSKVQALNKQIEQRKNATLDDLPVERKEQQAPLVEFLAWRWEQQTAWLDKELGAERTKELVGEPVTLAYTFITAGDADAGGMRDQFGEPYGGGLYYGSGMGGLSSSNGVEHTTVGPFDPASGKIKQRSSGRRTDAPKRPVDVPEGWTLDDAWKNLKEVEKRGAELGQQYGEQLDFRRMAMGRGGFEQRRVVESQARQDGQLHSLELEKAERIVEELGGDPQKEAKQIHEAQMTFRGNRGITCNQPPFVSHVKVTAEQQNALDKIADEYGSNVYRFSEEEKLDYHDAILDVLDKSQKRLFKQLLFRQYWFSQDCELAFALTKVKLTEEQTEKVASLAKRLRETNEEIQLAQRSSMTRGGFHFRSTLRSRNTAYKPMLAMVKEFNETLEELVGAKNAVALLGKSMEHDPNWKRPVIIPEGLSLQQAKKQHEELAADVKAREEDSSNLFESLLEQGALGNGLDVEAQMQASQEEFQQLKRKSEIASRIYEELKAAEEK